MWHPVTFHYPSIFAEVLFKSLLGGLSIKPPNKEFPWSVCLRHICAFNLKGGKTHFRKTKQIYLKSLPSIQLEVTGVTITVHRRNNVPSHMKSSQRQPT